MPTRRVRHNSGEQSATADAGKVKDRCRKNTEYHCEQRPTEPTRTHDSRTTATTTLRCTLAVTTIAARPASPSATDKPIKSGFHRCARVCVIAYRCTQNKLCRPAGRERGLNIRHSRLLFYL
ncbi:hypothetical protein QTP88_007492 [Uroleucon formosanum]